MKNDKNALLLSTPAHGRSGAGDCSIQVVGDPGTMFELSQS
jgi:hypothetical protein